MALIQYLVFDERPLLLPHSYEVSIGDVGGFRRGGGGRV